MLRNRLNVVGAGSIYCLPVNENMGMTVLKRGGGKVHASRLACAQTAIMSSRIQPSSHPRDLRRDRPGQVTEFPDHLFASVRRRVWITRALQCPSEPEKLG